MREIKQVAYTSPAFTHDALRLRLEVFCEEQHVPVENERDADDPSALHYVLYEDGHAHGVFRILRPAGAIDAKLGRLAVSLPQRNRGLAEEMMRYAEGVCREHGWPRLALHAQTYLNKFYMRLGYTHDETRASWDEEGMDHIYMYKDL